MEPWVGTGKEEIHEWEIPAGNFLSVFFFFAGNMDAGWGGKEKKEMNQSKRNTAKTPNKRAAGRETRSEGMGKRGENPAGSHGSHGYGVGNGVPTSGNLFPLLGRGISQNKERETPKQGGEYPKPGRGKSFGNIPNQGEEHPKIWRGKSCGNILKLGSGISQTREWNIPK